MNPPPKPDHVTPTEYQVWLKHLHRQPDSVQRLAFTYPPWRHYCDEEKQLGFRPQGVIMGPEKKDEESQVTLYGQHIYANGWETATVDPTHLREIDLQTWNALPEVRHFKDLQAFVSKHPRQGPLFLQSLVAALGESVRLTPH